MNLAIPRENNTELLVYLWKIIDLPNIKLNDLLYRISYELFLLPPDRGKDFIKNCLKDNLLTEDDNGNLSLSPSLNERLIKWQKRRKKEILKKMESVEKKDRLATSIEHDQKSSFSIFIKSFAEKGTINRAVNISNNAFEIKEFDKERSIIKSSVVGSKEESYYLEINLENKLLLHNCHDFITRKSKVKHFCKHLVKFFLLLREKFPITAETLIKDLGDHIDKWEFSS
ncbi:MAG: hypothetical protein ACFE8B_08880 [Candidatus Hermodarchaeota archaeon]